tara:strand:+ start:1099 stop:1755 length:657 start_codon:yes stop_codon:yes gene_type:complete
MPKAKPFTKDQILNAMDKTLSVRAAARYLNCSYQHLKKWMKEYKDEDGITLFDKHKNPHGKGIPKFLSSKNGFKSKEPPILDIIEGRVDASSFNPDKLKYRAIEAGLMVEECKRCGFNEQRVIDSKIPLLLHFNDNVSTHWGLDNVHLLCYNCYFLYYGNVFTEKELDQLEGHNSVTIKTEETKMDLDPYHISRLKEIGMYDDPNKEDDDPYSLVSRK